MSKKKIKLPSPSKEELKSMVETYFGNGGVIKVCPTRYASNYFRATLTHVYPAKIARDK